MYAGVASISPSRAIPPDDIEGRKEDRMQWSSVEDSYHHNNVSKIGSTSSNLSNEPSISSTSGSSFSQSTSSTHTSASLSRSRAPPSGDLKRCMDKDLPLPPPLETDDGGTSLAFSTPLSLGVATGATYCASLNASPSFGTPSLRTYLQTSDASVAHYGHEASPRSMLSDDDRNDEHHVAGISNGRPAKGRRRWANGAAGAAGGVSAGLKKLSKASTSALRSAAQQQQQWKADREAAAAATALERRSQATSEGTPSTSTGQPLSVTSNGSTGKGSRVWGLGISNVRAASQHPSKAASAPSSASVKGDTDFQAFWQQQQNDENGSLRVPPPQSATHSSSGGSWRSSLSQGSGGTLRESQSVDYAFPPGPIAEPDAGISLPFDVQHNVHVQMGPEGYTGLPISWAEHLAEGAQDAVEDDPRRLLESRLEGHYREGRSRSRASSLESPSRSPRLMYRRNTAHSDEFDATRVRSIAMTDDSSGKRTIRPSMAASRASTSYSSVLHKGWDDWSDAGGRERGMNSPPPPVPPLPNKKMTAHAREGDQHRLHDISNDSEEWVDGEEVGRTQTGLGLDLAGFSPVSPMHRRDDIVVEAASSRKMLLPDFLSDGNKDDEDWALMLLNSIPAPDDEQQVVLTHHARKPSKHHQVRPKSSASSMRSKKSVSIARKAKAPSSAFNGTEGARTPQSPMLPQLPQIPSHSTLSVGDKQTNPSEFLARPASRTSRKSTVRSAGKKRASVVAARRASRRTFVSYVTTDISGDEDEWSDGGAYSGMEEDEAQITTATTERLGKAGTLPRALTHSQLVGKVRQYGPGGARNHTSSQPKQVGRPDLATALSDDNTASLDRSNGQLMQRETSDVSPAASAWSPPSPSIRSTKSKNSRKSRAKARGEEGAGREGSTKKLANLTANAKKALSPLMPPREAAGGLSIASATKNANASLNRLGVAGHAAKAADLAKVGSVRIIASAAEAHMFMKAPVTGEVVPPSKNALGTHESNGNLGDAPALQPDDGPKIMGLRERRKLKGPATIYPPSKNYVTATLARPRPNTTLSVATDAGLALALEIPYASNGTQNCSVDGGHVGGKPDSPSSVSAGAAAGSTTIRGFFKRGSESGQAATSPEGLANPLLSPQQFQSPVHSPSNSFGLSLRNVVRTRSGSTANDGAPRVPPKDSPALGSASTDPRTGDSEVSQDHRAQMKKAAQIGFIRPDANGFFTVSAPPRSDTVDHAQMPPTSHQAPTTCGSAVSTPQDAHQSSDRQVKEAPVGLPSPRSGFDDDEYSDDEDEEGTGDYTADDYLQDWMQEEDGRHVQRSPAQVSILSNGSGSVIDGNRRAPKGYPVSSTAARATGLSPRLDHDLDGSLRSSTLRTSPSYHGPRLATSTHSSLSSPIDLRDQATPSPFPTPYKPPADTKGSLSPIIDKLQPPIPPIEGSPAEMTRSVSSVAGLAYLGSGAPSSSSLRGLSGQSGSSQPAVEREISHPPVTRMKKTYASTDTMMVTRSSRGLAPEEAMITTRPSSRVSNSSRTSRRTTNKVRRRSADVRNRFPVSTHYASGLSEGFFDLSTDLGTVPRQSFDLEEVLPQHLNNVPPVPPLPNTANGHLVSSPPTPVRASHFIPIASSDVQIYKAAQPASAGPPPSVSRTHSRQSSIGTRKSPRRSRSRTHLNLYGGTSVEATMPTSDKDKDKALSDVTNAVKASKISSAAPRSRGEEASDLPDCVKPAAKYLVAADPEVLFHDMTLIGSGESGDVFSAVGPGSTGGEEVVAVKILKLPDSVSTSSAIQETTRLGGLDKEISLWSACKHDKVLALHDVFFSPTPSDYAGVWITQELADRSLADIVALHSDGLIIPEPSMAKVLSDVLEALQCLHAKLIIHRDVRSDNVLICADGTAKLSDFTQAAQLATETDKRSSRVGIAYWMAPELTTSERYATEVDIWSLGATLYEMCEGQPPNVDLSPEQAVAATRQSGLPALSDRGEEVMPWSRNLTNFLSMATKADPKQRASASALLKSNFVKRKADQGKIVELLQHACELEGQGDDADEAGSL